jgi:hypothetical protein
MTPLYARVFTQILDSSLAEDWQARHVFEDMLKLADDGVLDMTRQAFVRRTNVPLEIVERVIAVLESPDPASRDAAEDGRRIVRLDDHRDWGWRIVNAEKYAAIRTAQDQREKTAERARRYRARKASTLPLHPLPEDIDIDIDIGRHAPSRSVTSHSVTKLIKNKLQKAASAALSFVFPAGLETPKFQAVWGLWVPYRTGRSRIKGDRQDFFDRQLAKCAQLGEADSITKLELAMLNNWQGFLFEAKGTTTGTSSVAPQSSPLTQQQILTQSL